MTDHDLLDRMTETAGWAATAPVDPAADLARGRRRLRHRRLGLATIVVMAVAGTTLGVNALAGRPSTAPPDGAVARPGTPTAADTRSRLSETEALRIAASRHLDSGGTHLRMTSGGSSSKRFVEFEAMWRQGSGTGVAMVWVVSAAGRPKDGNRYNFEFDPGACRLPRRPGAINPPYSCRWTTVNGHQVRFGTSDVAGVKSYFAGYLRPDGLFVAAAIEGDRRGANARSVNASTGDEVVYPPVRQPAVTLDDLVATVTDPAITLR